MVQRRKEARRRKRTGSNKKQLSVEIRAVYDMLTLARVIIQDACIYMLFQTNTECTKSIM